MLFLLSAGGSSVQRPDQVLGRDSVPGAKVPETRPARLVVRGFTTGQPLSNALSAKPRRHSSFVTPFLTSSAISLSLYPASRSTSAECSPKRGAGRGTPGWDADQLVGVRMARSSPSLG